MQSVGALVASLDNGYAAKPWSRASPAECRMHINGWLLLVAVRGSPTSRPSAAPTAWNCSEAVARSKCGVNLERFCNATNATAARAGLAAASRCADGDDGDDDAAPTDAATFATAALWVLGGVVLLGMLFGGFCIVRAARRRDARRHFSAAEACRAGAYWTPRGDDVALRIAR